MEKEKEYFKPFVQVVNEDNGTTADLGEWSCDDNAGVDQPMPLGLRPFLLLYAYKDWWSTRHQQYNPLHAIRSLIKA